MSCVTNWGGSLLIDHQSSSVVSRRERDERSRLLGRLTFAKEESSDDAILLEASNNGEWGDIHSILSGVCEVVVVLLSSWC